jgi:long-chain acyl-CoA synthetase
MHYAELTQAWEEMIAPGSPFEIVENQIGGQNLRCFKHAPANIREFWLSTAAFADRTYLVYEDERLTYAQSHAQVAAIAAWLDAQGVKIGDRVAIGMRNYPEWMLIYWACVSTGIAVVGMNAWWTPEEMAYALADSAPKARAGVRGYARPEKRSNREKRRPTQSDRHCEHSEAIQSHRCGPSQCKQHTTCNW